VRIHESRCHGTIRQNDRRRCQSFTDLADATIITDGDLHAANESIIEPCQVRFVDDRHGDIPCQRSSRVVTTSRPSRSSCNVMYSSGLWARDIEPGPHRAHVMSNPF